MRESSGHAFLPHPHYERRGEWEFFHGNPRRYLGVLRGVANRFYAESAGRMPKPPGKNQFDRFVAGQGARVPKTLAFVAGGEVSHGRADSKQTLVQFLRELPHGHYFCKPDDGIMGVDAFHLENLPGAVKMGGEDADLGQLAARLSRRAYLIQEWLVPRQHGDVARFNPSVINTIRLVTFDTKPSPSVVAGCFRSAIGSKSVDNWAAGGVAVAIDLGRGMLAGRGLVKQGYEMLAIHPVSGVAFDGAAIPHFSEAVRLVENLHAKLQAMSLGWDIVLLDEGPLVMECNFPTWDFSLSALLDVTLTAKLLACHVTEPSSILRLDFSGRFPNRDDVCDFICRILGRSSLSGRLESLSQEEFTLTVAGSSGALGHLGEQLKLPRNRGQFRTVRSTSSHERIRPGLDLYAAF